jgi:biofilm PGA synthesis N-glycosyltransferase PgaC
MKIIYWISLLILIWVFCGYPILMILLAKLRRRKSAAGLPDSSLPSITLLVCAHNEEKVIGEKIQNSLSLDYPNDKFKLVVVSDGSSDRHSIPTPTGEGRPKRSMLDLGICPAKLSF